MAEKTDEQRKVEWLEARRQHITSTDVAPLMGLPDAYGSPMKVWLDKTGKAEQSDEVPEFMTWGNRLQEAILKGYADRVQEPINLADPYDLIVVPDSILASSLDARWSTKDLRPVDAKNVGRVSDEWGEAMTDHIPPRYVVQLHVQMLATGTQMADLAALFGGRAMRVYRISRDEEIIAACREAAEAFWRNHVLADIPPPVDSSEDWARFLNSRKQKTGAFIDATPEALEWATKLRQVVAAQDELAALEREAQNHLKAIIGENAGLKGSFGRISYKRNKDSPKVDEGAVIDALAAKLCAVDPALAAFVESVTKEHTVNKTGPRRFLPTWHEEG